LEKAKQDLFQILYLDFTLTLSINRGC